MTQAFQPSAVLDHIGGALSIAVMAGLTFAGAATWAHSAPAVPAAIVQLPPVVVTVKRATPTVAQLPTVVVVAKRASGTPQA